MFTAQDLYGATPQAPSLGVQAATEPLATGTDGLGGWRTIVDPRNPLAWFGVFLLATVGFASVAGSARIGTAKVTASLG
jgi:hypothetical protein